MKAIDLTALILLAKDDPTGTYLLEVCNGLRLLWRLSEGGPEDEAFAPTALWPLLLPPDS